MNLKNSAEQLLEIKRVFDSQNISFWLVGGTLLAAIRDKQFFNWDHDMDISMLASDWSKEFEELFKPYFRVNELKYGLGRVTGFDLNRTSDVRTNVFLEFLNPEKKVYVRVFPPRTLSSNITPVEYFNPNFVEFIGTQFRVFDKPEEILERWYGDWRTPVKRGVPWKKDWKPLDKNYTIGLIK
jgi:phosphorylcholine metabolism protein LicD